ncbi:hypothetical protein D3C78_1299240 [compost metagenome]
MCRSRQQHHINLGIEGRNSEVSLPIKSVKISVQIYSDQHFKATGLIKLKPLKQLTVLLQKRAFTPTIDNISFLNAMYQRRHSVS